MNNFLNEFKKFINRGNVMDMAVGVIIGGAFSTVVNFLVADIINPILGLFGGTNLQNYAWNIKDEVYIYYGAFINAVINFIVMAFVVFIMIKGLNKLKDGLESISGKKKEEAATEKECPYCMSRINIKAVKCPNCTSNLEQIIEKGQKI